MSTKMSSRRLNNQTVDRSFRTQAEAESFAQTESGRQPGITIYVVDSQSIFYADTNRQLDPNQVFISAWKNGAII